MDFELYGFDGIFKPDDPVEGEMTTPTSWPYAWELRVWQSKLSLSDNASVTDEKAKSALKLGLFSYPVLQAADILVHR